jgi:DNA-binding CsgD family transcriptional regulator
MVAVERLAGTLVAGLRRTVVAQQTTSEQPGQGPGLVVLDRHGQVESLTPAARHWLDELGEDPPVLSDREQAVTALVFQGRSTRQIAWTLKISPYTVQEHLTSSFDKVGVRSRGELVGQVFFRHCLPAIPE